MKAASSADSGVELSGEVERRYGDRVPVGASKGEEKSDSSAGEEGTEVEVRGPSTIVGVR